MSSTPAAVDEGAVPQTPEPMSPRTPLKTPARAEPTSPPQAQTADWARAPERSNALALRVMCWIALTCGRRVARWVLHPITLYFVLSSPAAKRHSRRYLTRALGRVARWRDVYHHFFSFSATILDRVYLLRGRGDLFDMDVHCKPSIEAVLTSGQGGFLIGAHMGSFEALRVAGGRYAKLRLAMVMYPDNARLINTALRAIAPDAVPEIISLGRMDSMLAIRDWLDAGGVAGMLADRTLGAEPQRSGMVRVNFLGHDVEFGDGPFRLAALLRRRVVFMAGMYGGGARYDAYFELLADFSERISDAGERERRIEQVVRAYAARLESLCRSQPYNWFNFYDFWREETS